MPQLEKVSENSWFAWSKTVLLQLEQDTKKLDKHEKCLKEVKDLLTLARIDIAQLKIKSGIWGAIGGGIPVVVALGIWWITK